MSMTRNSVLGRPAALVAAAALAFTAVACDEDTGLDDITSEHDDPAADPEDDPGLDVTDDTADDQTGTGTGDS